MSKEIVLAVAGSPRRHGNTDHLLEEAMRGARDADLEVVHLVVSRCKLSGCSACGGCAADGRCRVADDMQKVFADIDRAHHLILASPLFFMDLPGQLKCLIDRCQVYWTRKHRLHLPTGREHPGGNGSVILAGGTGFEHLFDAPRTVLKSLFHVLELHYKDELLLRHVDRRGDVEKHPDALAAAYELGRNIARPPG